MKSLIPILNNSIKKTNTLGLISTCQANSINFTIDLLQELGMTNMNTLNRLQNLNYLTETDIILALDTTIDKPQLEFNYNLAEVDSDKQIKKLETTLLTTILEEISKKENLEDTLINITNEVFKKYKFSVKLDKENILYQKTLEFFKDNQDVIIKSLKYTPINDYLSVFKNPKSKGIQRGFIIILSTLIMNLIIEELGRLYFNNNKNIISQSNNSKVTTYYQYDNLEETLESLENFIKVSYFKPFLMETLTTLIITIPIPVTKKHLLKSDRLNINIPKIENFYENGALSIKSDITIINESIYDLKHPEILEKHNLDLMRNFLTTTIINLNNDKLEIENLNEIIRAEKYGYDLSKVIKFNNTEIEDNIINMLNTLETKTINKQENLQENLNDILCSSIEEGVLTFSKVNPLKLKNKRVTTCSGGHEGLLESLNQVSLVSFSSYLGRISTDLEGQNQANLVVFKHFFEEEKISENLLVEYYLEVLRADKGMVPKILETTKIGKNKQTMKITPYVYQKLNPTIALKTAFNKLIEYEKVKMFAKDLVYNDYKLTLDLNSILEGEILPTTNYSYIITDARKKAVANMGDYEVETIEKEIDNLLEEDFKNSQLINSYFRELLSNLYNTREPLVEKSDGTPVVFHPVIEEEFKTMIGHTTFKSILYEISKTKTKEVLLKYKTMIMEEPDKDRIKSEVYKTMLCILT